MLKRELIIALRKVIKYLNTFNTYDYVYILNTGYMTVLDGNSIYIAEFPSFKIHDESFVFHKHEAKKMLKHFETRICGGSEIIFEKNGMTANVKDGTNDLVIKLDEGGYEIGLVEDTVNKINNIESYDCKPTTRFSCNGFYLSSLINIIINEGKEDMFFDMYEQNEMPYVMIGFPYRSNFESEKFAIMAKYIER